MYAAIFTLIAGTIADPGNTCNGIKHFGRQRQISYIPCSTGFGTLNSNTPPTITVPSGADREILTCFNQLELRQQRSAIAHHNAYHFTGNEFAASYLTYRFRAH